MTSDLDIRCKEFDPDLLRLRSATGGTAGQSRWCTPPFSAVDVSRRRRREVVSGAGGHARSLRLLYLAAVLQQ